MQTGGQVYIFVEVILLAIEVILLAIEVVMPMEIINWVVGV